MVILAALNLAVIALHILSSGIGAYLSGAALAQEVSSYGASGGSIGGLLGLQVLLFEVLLASAVFYAAQSFSQQRPISYRVLVPALVFLPIVGFQRIEFFSGLLAIFGVAAMDHQRRRRLAITITGRTAPHHRAHPRQRILIRMVILFAFVFVSYIAIGAQRQNAFSETYGKPTDTSTLHFVSEELTTVYAISDIQANGQQLKLQHGGTIILPLFFRYVPHSIFADKPLNGGAYYARTLHPDDYAAGFSIPPTAFGDGLINFGFSGLLGVAIALGLLTRYCDNIYFRGDESRAILYILGMSYVYILMRNDIATAGASICLALVIFVVLGFILARTGLVQRGAGEQSRQKRLPRIRAGVPEDRGKTPDHGPDEGLQFPDDWP